MAKTPKTEAERAAADEVAEHRQASGNALLDLVVSCVTDFLNGKAKLMVTQVHDSDGVTSIVTFTRNGSNG